MTTQGSMPRSTLKRSLVTADMIIMLLIALVFSTLVLILNAKPAHAASKEYAYADWPGGTTGGYT